MKGPQIYINEILIITSELLNKIMHFNKFEDTYSYINNNPYTN